MCRAPVRKHLYFYKRPNIILRIRDRLGTGLGNHKVGLLGSPAAYISPRGKSLCVRDLEAPMRLKAMQLKPTKYEAVDSNVRWNDTFLRLSASRLIS
jgi:hypothetical protein